MLGDYFDAQFTTLAATRAARAYIAGLFVQQAVRPVDYSRESIVLAYAAGPDFAGLQALGDWVLWVDTVMPGALDGCREVAQSIGRLSYHRCYRRVPEWRVYEELGDNLPRLVHQLRVVIEPGDAAETDDLTF